MITFTEGERIDWTPRLGLRMLRYGVQSGRRPVPRRIVIGWHIRMLRAWWKWTAALPGDRFWDPLRDRYVQVDGGTRRNRTVKIVAGQLAEHYGPEAAFGDTRPEPFTGDWRQLA